MNDLITRLSPRTVSELVLSLQVQQLRTNRPKISLAVDVAQSSAEERLTAVRLPVPYIDRV